MQHTSTQPGNDLSGPEMTILPNTANATDDQHATRPARTLMADEPGTNVKRATPTALLAGPTVGLAVALAVSLLITGQVLLFLHYYGDTLAETRLPYMESFAETERLDYRQFGGTWEVNDEKLVQLDTQDTDLLAVLPRLKLPADASYTFGARIQVLSGPKGGGLVFNMQEPTSRRMSHMVRFGSDDSGDYLVWGYFDEGSAYVAQGSTQPPAFTDVVDLEVLVGPESYAVLVNGETVAQDVPLQYLGGHLALTTWFSSIAFDDVIVNNGNAVPAAPQAQAAAAQESEEESAREALQSPATSASTAADAPSDAPAGVPAGVPNTQIEAQPEMLTFDTNFGAVLNDGNAEGGWRVVSGDWQIDGDALVQLSPTGFDHTILYAGRFSTFTLRTRFRHREGVGAGIIFNAPDVNGNKRGHLVRYMEPDVLAWGYFDTEAVFQGQGGAEVAPAGTDVHTLEVTVAGGTYAVTLDGTTLAQDVPLVHTEGAVGLTASESVVAFTGFGLELVNPGRGERDVPSQ